MSYASIEDAREYQRQWRAANRDKTRGYVRKWRDANRSAANLSSLRWQKANLDKHAEAEARRRARARGAEHTPWTRAEVWEQGSGMCYLCSQPLDPDKWHADHVMPLARGGRDALDNLMPTHPRCNQTKHATVLL